MKPFSLLSFAGLGLLSTAMAVDFKEEVRPILNKKCFKCHTGPKAKGGLRMDSEDDFAKRIGGDDPVIIPGDPAKSLLAVKAGLPATDGDAMPPPPARERGAEPMTSGELNVVRQWITEGAKFSAGTASTTAAPATAPTTPAPAAGAMKAEMRTWTNSAGAALQASFVALNGANVTLKKEDGTQFDYPLANLSAESQALAKQLAAGQ
jgi:hypothetical protein